MSIASRKIVLSAAGAGGVVGGGFLTEFGVLNTSSVYIQVDCKPVEALSVFGASWADHVYVAGRIYPYPGGSGVYSAMWAGMIDSSDGSMPDSFSDYNTQSSGSATQMSVQELLIYRDTSTSDNSSVWAGWCAGYSQGYLINYIYASTWVYSTGQTWKLSTDFLYCAKHENPTATNQRAFYVGGTRLYSGDYRATFDRINTSNAITNSTQLTYSSNRNDNAQALTVIGSNNYVVSNIRWDQNSFSGHAILSPTLGFAGAYSLSLSTTYANSDQLAWSGLSRSICGNSYFYSAGSFTGASINNAKQMGYVGRLSGTISLTLDWNKCYYTYDVTIQFWSIAEHSDGDLLISGRYEHPTIGDSGLIMKLDSSDGSIIYAKAMRKSGVTTYTRSVTEHSDGRLIVQGVVTNNNDQFVAFISEDTLGDFGDYNFVDISGDITTATVATLSTLSVTASTTTISTSAAGSSGVGADLDTTTYTLA